MKNNYNFIEELRWRGMLHDMIPGLEEQLAKEMTTAYIGFDPTAPSLHIGNLAAIMLLKHFQLAGHKPIALVGGATGMIGDPSGKNAEREFLSEDTLRENQIGIQKQLEKFLDFHAGANSAEVVNNYDWFKEFSFLGFLREAGKFLTVNYMMSKDSVKNRLETGLSFTEFSYQLLQGYDFYHLYKTKNVRLQMGGSDQWGNITTGTEIIRRKEGTGEDETDRAFALTTPLVTKSDGTKFGKSESGNVWLDKKKTNISDFIQFWLNITDEDAKKFIKIFTLLNKIEIEKLVSEHSIAPHKRILQRRIAEEVSSFVHGIETTKECFKIIDYLYSNSEVEEIENKIVNNSAIDSEFKIVSEGFTNYNNKKNKGIIRNMNDNNQVVGSHSNSLNYLRRGHFISIPTINTNNNILEILTNDIGNILFESKTEARKALVSGSLRINKQKISDPYISSNELRNIFNKTQDIIIIEFGKKKKLIAEKSNFK